MSEQDHLEAEEHADAPAEGPGAAALSKQYTPADVEARWSAYWLKEGLFHADEQSSTVPYAITLPPPNVTGSLHMGHALGSTLQDTLIRWRRMQGFNAMWMPGTDHASIAVHHLLEKDLRKREGKTRFDLGRDVFMERAWAWREKSGNRIGAQEKTMGFSLDWARERFTMDEQSNKAVREAFVRMFEEGLIYRAKRMINWDPISETVVSDLEVNTTEEAGHMWELKYPIAGTSEFLIVATTRPETMLGDTGVAVHPDDERYKHLIGKRIALPLTGREIPIVGDTFVDPEFGSGAVKVTPAHDFNDFECAQRCGLEIIEIIDAKGRICAPAPAAYVGMLVDDARKAVVAALEAAELLGNIKDHTVPRGRSERSGAVVEPMLMEQWFVKTESLAKPAIEAVESGKTKFIPELWTKTYMHWMTNIKDWCISRQLWWGHRIPAWYCGACNHIAVLRDDPTSCPSCGSAQIKQDEDILDTWFSSALWPFSTLGWPEKTKELTAFYPNNVLVTGPDIIFFWVARMMMMGLHFMGKVPFKTVYLTSIVTDENGDKMSKTKGNVLDPLDVIGGISLEDLLARAETDNLPEPAQKALRKSYPKGITAMGSDALRFTLAALNTSGRYIRLSLDRVEGYRNFINKLWNASRFALLNLADHNADEFAKQLQDSNTRASLGLGERWILSRLQRTCAEVDGALENYRFADAAGALYHFVWHEFCDWYIELAKPKLRVDPEVPLGPEAAALRRQTQGVLAHVLEQILRLMHPITPFVTEEIWRQLPKASGLPHSLMCTLYPKSQPALVDEEAERIMKTAQEVTVAIRMLRATYGISPAQPVSATLVSDQAQVREELALTNSMISRAARAKLTIDAVAPTLKQAARTAVGGNITVVVPVEGLIDIAAEKQRIVKEMGKVEKDIAGLERKLENQDFLARAPEEVVAEQRARLTEEQARRQRFVDAIASLS